MVLDHLVKEKLVHFSNDGQKRVGDFILLQYFFLVLKKAVPVLLS